MSIKMSRQLYAKEINSKQSHKINFDIIQL